MVSINRPVPQVITPTTTTQTAIRTICAMNFLPDTGQRRHYAVTPQYVRKVNRALRNCTYVWPLPPLWHSRPAAVTPPAVAWGQPAPPQAEPRGTIASCA